MSNGRSKKEVLEEFKRRFQGLEWYGELLKDLEGKGVTLDEVITKRSRMSHIIAARHYAWAFVRDRMYPTWSWSALGYVFGVDHTTFMTAVKSKYEPGETKREKHG